MGRFSRMGLFILNSAILLMGLAAGIYCYTVSLTSGSIFKDIFPFPLLIGIIVLAIISILISVLGCYSGYQQTVISLSVYVILLTLLLIGQLVVGWSAFNESKRSLATLNKFWTNASTIQLQDLQNTYSCCGHLTLKKQVECPDNFSSTCDIVVTNALSNFMQTFAISTWALAILPLGSIIVSLVLMRSIYKSNRPQRSKYIVPN